jgi:hypothetical protein
MKLTEEILEMSKEIILTKFDREERKNKTIQAEGDGFKIRVRRNCFQKNDIFQDYFEDFAVIYDGMKHGRRIYTHFYMEWYNENELRPTQKPRIQISKNKHHHL